MSITNQFYQLPSPLQQLELGWSQERQLRFYVKRDDLIHDAVSGNKWRKLKFNILQAKHAQKSGILTFGGAFSNHILATAHACKMEGLHSIAIIRGEELNENSNDILRQCADLGMTFRFITREEYNLKDEYEYMNELKSEFSSYHIVPEGGKNYLGMIGCQDIVREIDIDFDEIWTAQGTCTTSIGLAMSCLDHQKVHAVPVLKGFDALTEMTTLMNKQGLGADFIEDILEKLVLHPQYHFGGYGKTTPELLDFIENIEDQLRFKLDPVYTGKAFYAMLDYYKKSNLENKTILFLHTGGLIAGEFAK
jgi:1-aminocyclopropane-1-carboxylate deaminase